MAERFRIRSAVLLFLLRSIDGQQEVLLQKRQNTGYADGMWDCAAGGHVEANESMKMAMIREAKEEINIDIDINNVDFATMTHKFTPITRDSYYNAFFVVKVYDGTPIINESEKCSALQWFNIKELPNDLLTDRRQALENYLSKISYDESGWELL